MVALDHSLAGNQVSDSFLRFIAYRTNLLNRPAFRITEQPVVCAS